MVQHAVQHPSFVPEEADVLARVAGLPVDLGATARGAALHRAAQAVRGELERTVLRPEGLSFTGFSLLFNLWVWGAMQTRALASSMGCTRATVSSVSDTLEGGGPGTRRGDAPGRRPRHHAPPTSRLLPGPAARGRVDPLGRAGARRPRHASRGRLGPPPRPAGAHPGGP